MNTETLLYIPQMFTKILSNFKLKLIGSFIISAYGFLFDKAHEQALIALLVLIILDFMLGVISAYKTGVEIKSAKIFRSALKTAVYFLLVAAGNLASIAGVDFIHIDKLIISFLAVTELISIIENTGNMGYAIPKKVLNKLKGYTKTQ